MSVRQAIIHYSKAGHEFSSEDRLLMYKVQTLVVLGSITALALGLLSILRFSEGNLLQGWFDAFFCLIMVVGYLLLKRSLNYYDGVSRTILIVGMLGVILVMHLVPDNPTRFSWAFIIVLMMFFLRDGREGSLMLIAYVMLLIVLQLFNPEIFSLSMIDFVVLIINILLIFGALFWYEKIKQERSEALEVSNSILEMKVEARTEELLYAKKLAESGSESKSRFIANMSHELRTPLNAISGMTYLLQLDSLSEEQNQYLDQIKKSSDDLLQLIKGILEYSDLEAEQKLKLTPFAVQDLLNGLIHKTELLTSERNQPFISTVTEAVPICLIGNGKYIEAMILILLDNAVKFTPKGGLVHFSVDWNPTETGLHILVKDRGCGISPEQQPTIFEAFYQADATTTRGYAGTGIGLAIFKRLLDLMKGSVTVVSEVGVGTEFNVFLPLVPCPKCPEASVFSQKTEGRSKAMPLAESVTDGESTSQLDSQMDRPPLLLEEFEEFKVLVESADIQAEKWIVKLCKRYRSTEYETDLKEIKELIHSYDFDLALAKLAELQQKMSRAGVS